MLIPNPRPFLKEAFFIHPNILEIKVNSLNCFKILNILFNVISAYCHTPKPFWYTAYGKTGICKTILDLYWFFFLLMSRSWRLRVWPHQRRCPRSCKLRMTILEIAVLKLLLVRQPLRAWLHHGTNWSRYSKKAWRLLYHLAVNIYVWKQAFLI